MHNNLTNSLFEWTLTFCTLLCISESRDQLKFNCIRGLSYSDSLYRYRNHHVHLSVCPTFENVDIKSMCEFHVIKCILFDFGITSMVKNIHTTFAWKLISCGNFGKKICCKIHLGHNQLYLTGHVGYSPFRIVSSWLYCRTSITRILMFSLLTTIALKKDFF